MEVVYDMLDLKLSLCIIGLIIHCIGIYALTKTKKRSNQVLILLNLSISELIMLSSFAVSSVVGRVFYKDHHYEHSKTFNEFRSASLPSEYMRWKAYVTQVGVVETLISLMFLTIDRVIHTVLPFRYAICRIYIN